MRKKASTWLLLAAVTILLVVDCSPNLTPATPAPKPTAPVASTALVSGSEDVSWAKVVSVAQKEGRLNVYSYNMTGDVGLVVSSAFEQKHGIKVDFITGGGAALAQRITTEKRMNTMVADIMDANTFQISNIKDAGATVVTTDLPVLKESNVWSLEPWANDPQRHMFIHTITFYPVIVNTDLVKPAEEPKSLKELAQSRWKGQITAFDPRQNSALSTVFPTLINRKLIDQDTVRAIGMNDVKFVPTSDEAAKSVIRGQYALYLITSTANMGTFIMSAGTALPVKALDSAEGVIAANRSIGVIKDSPHPNAAKLFTNWVLSQEGQMVLAKAQGAVPVRKDVPDFTPATLRVSQSRVVMPTIEEEKENTRLFRDSWLAKLWNR